MKNKVRISLLAFSICLIIGGQTMAAIATTNETIFLQSENLVVYQWEIDLMFQRYEAFGTPRSIEEVARLLLRREAMYHAALQNGFSITDEELSDEIRRMHGFMLFPDTLAAAGVLEEDFWRFEHRHAERNLVSMGFLEAKLDAFFGDDDIDEEGTDLFNTYMEEIIAQVFEDEGIDIDTITEDGEIIIPPQDNGNIASPKDDVSGIDWVLITVISLCGVVIIVIVLYFVKRSSSKKKL